MGFFPYDRVSEFFEDLVDFPENLDDSAEHDAARVEWEDQAYEEWAAEHAEDIAEAEYQAWAVFREEDGMDFSREAYEAHIDALVSEREPD